MEKPIRLIYSLLTIIIATCLITNAAYCQNSNKGNSNDKDKGIVHNDQTGIVIDIIKKDESTKTALVKDSKSGKNLISIPTHLAVEKGKQVVYRKLNGKGNKGKGKGKNKSNGNTNSYCDTNMCEIKSVQ
ncbi:MAG: hypothetical protein JKY33_02700 [Bacteroidia bacterium]|nr:hypothetical protein [Bacteroidia bacterium]